MNLESVLPPQATLRAEDIARACRTNIRTVKRWVRQGTLPPPALVINQKCQLFDRAAVLAALEKHLVQEVQP